MTGQPEGDNRGPEPAATLVIGVMLGVLGVIIYLASEDAGDVVRYGALGLLWFSGIAQAIGVIGLGVQYGVNHSRNG